MWDLFVKVGTLLILLEIVIPIILAIIHRVRRSNAKRCPCCKGVLENRGWSAVDKAYDIYKCKECNQVFYIGREE